MLFGTAIHIVNVVYFIAIDEIKGSRYTNIHIVKMLVLLFIGKDDSLSKYNSESYYHLVPFILF